MGYDFLLKSAGYVSNGGLGNYIVDRAFVLLGRDFLMTEIFVLK